ncbi:RNA polymerase sigma factor [Kiloniella sp. b19]|uniref:RNA polymerase sigma factor n=1 Tax=Kiloniella sp. GXU_MW_B19 TaxID=3141326 RepID=UPI0031DA4C9C
MTKQRADEARARELLEQISEGSEAALADFYRLFERSLYLFVLSKMNDSFEAADIVNETFMEVWRKAGSFEGRSKVSTWLFGIAYFKTVDRFRKKKEVLFGEDDHREDQADEGPDAMSCLIEAENAQHVRHCLDQLKPVQKAVMHLAFFEEKPYSEIAVALDCPENTVKTRVFHAKQAMKHCLSRFMGAE